MCSKVKQVTPNEHKLKKMVVFPRLLCLVFLTLTLAPPHSLVSCMDLCSQSFCQCPDAGKQVTCNCESSSQVRHKQGNSESKTSSMYIVV